MNDWSIILNRKIIRQFPINEGDCLAIGRGNEADIILDNNAISRRHIALRLDEDCLFVTDLKSTNGTYVNGKRIDKETAITPGDSVEFGKFQLVATSHIDEDVDLSNSFSSMEMDLDEETIFVPNGKEAQGHKASSPKSAPRLSIVKGKGSPTELLLHDKTSVKAGKEADCNLFIPGFFVAKAQFYIFRKGNGYILVPQSSWAGTYINGRRASREIGLKPGDLIKVRGNTIRFDA